MRVPEGAKKKPLRPVIVRPPQSDEDDSDAETSSSDDETYDLKTQRNTCSSDKESDSSSELTEPFLQLKIGPDDADKKIDTTKYLSRSPTRNNTKKDLPSIRPYQTNDSKRRNSLQNCGYIVADNSFNTNFQYNPTQTVTNVLPQLSEWNEPLMQTDGPFSSQELEKIILHWERNPKEMDEIFGNFNDWTPLSSDDVAETLAQYNIPTESTNTPTENTSIPTEFTKLDFMRENSDTQQSDDSNYGTSCATSPSNSLSPSSNCSSQSSGYISSSTTESNKNGIKYAITFPPSAFDLKSQVDIDNTSTVLFSEGHYFHQNQSMPIVQNLIGPQLLGSKHLVVDNKQPAALVRTCPFSSEQKRHIKPILPKGTPVYDNPISARDRLHEKAERNQYRFAVEYIRSCLTKRSPAKWTETLYELLKVKRGPAKPDDWLAILYGHIECIYGRATNSMLQKEKEDEFANVLITKHKGQSLLYLACLNHEDLPIAARYIAEVIVGLNRDINESYTDDDGNSIIHVLAYKGDSHVNVLAELLLVKKGNLPVFDINFVNKRNQTALHLAVMAHTPQNPCFATISYLIEHGAKIVQDIENRTPLHYAVLGECEAEIIQKLLPENASSVVDLEDLEGNTAFLLVWNNDKMCSKKKNKIIEILTKNNVNLRLQTSKMTKRQIALE